MIIYRSWFQSYHHHYCLQNFIPIFRFWLSIWCSSLSSFEGCQFHFMFIDSALSSSPFSIVIGILLVVITITIMIIISATLILCSFLRHCQPLQQIGYVIVCGEPRGISGVVSSHIKQLVQDVPGIGTRNHVKSRHFGLFQGKMLTCYFMLELGKITLGSINTAQCARARLRFLIGSGSCQLTNASCGTCRYHHCAGGR